MACSWERDEIAFFLIKEEQKKITKERQEGQDGQPGKRGGGQQQHQGTPSYNMRSSGGYSPVFYAKSSKIVEEMVKSFPDLELEDGDGRQLLERGEHGLGRLFPSSSDSKCREEEEFPGIFHLLLHASSIEFLEVADSHTPLDGGLGTKYAGHTKDTLPKLIPKPTLNNSKVLRYKKIWPWFKFYFLFQPLS